MEVKVEKANIRFKNIDPEPLVYWTRRSVYKYVPQKRRARTVSIRMSDELYRQLETHAKVNNITVSEVIREAIKRYLGG